MFYHALGGRLDFDDVWYSNGRSLINPRNKDHGHCIDVVWAYYPLTIEEANAFTEWMAKNGDEAGIKAWNEYKGKLIKETKMAKNDDKEKRENVDLYDPKFVHFDWDEELQGKKAFHCDDINGLRHLVMAFYRDAYHEIQKSSNPSYPFQIGTHVWKFAYYDPNFEIKWAYFKEGKTIQEYWEYCDDADEGWIDLNEIYDLETISRPGFFDHDEEEYDEIRQFRIKPEEEKKPEVEVNVDVKVNNASSSDGRIKITINGKECVFENAEQARMVLKG